MKLHDKPRTRVNETKQNNRALRYDTPIKIGEIKGPSGKEMFATSHCNKSYCESDVANLYYWGLSEKVDPTPHHRVLFSPSVCEHFAHFSLWEKNSPN